jgi:hypothetical protein
MIALMHGVKIFNRVQAKLRNVPDDPVKDGTLLFV